MDGQYAYAPMDTSYTPLNTQYTPLSTSFTQPLTTSYHSPMASYLYMDKSMPLILSGASTVAIDNKIEQAMDLVKSHLMFAVREEVDVLREQIKELLEKNSQLEYENQILRQGASQDTLAKLQQPRPAVVARTQQNQPPASTS